MVCHSFRFNNAFDFVLCHLFIVLSLTVIASLIEPTKAAQEFDVYRLTQYDALSTPIGSRSSALSCDIQTLSSRPYARRCVMMKLTEVNVEGIRSAINNNCGGIIILLPSKGWREDSLTHWLNLESSLLKEDFPIPVYFAMESDELGSLFDKLREISRDADNSNGQSLFGSVFSTGYRAYINTPTAVPFKSLELINIEGSLSVGTFNEKRPTVVLTAHYDAGGAIPSLSYGANANAAGVTVLLETARVISRIVDSNNIPKYNVIFLLTGGGKFNYLGSKRWLEMMSEDTAGIALFDSIEMVVNLEGLGVNEEDQLFMHVSRPPKEGTFGHRLLAALESASKLHPLGSFPVSHAVEVVHKKINLNQYDLAWEHERFALYRLPTATLSASSSPTSYLYRDSSLDGGPLYGRSGPSRGYWGPVKSEVVARNAKVLSEALTRILFEMPSVSSGTPLVDPSTISTTSVGALMDLLTLSPRSSQLIEVPSARLGNKDPGIAGIISSLEQYMRSILPKVRLTRHHFANSAVTSGTDGKRAAVKNLQQESGSSASASSMPTLSAAGRDPEVVFYTGVHPQQVVVYRLKSSVFDLVIACFVGAYLYLLHVFLERFEMVIQVISTFSQGFKKKLKSN